MAGARQETRSVKFITPAESELVTTAPTRSPPSLAPSFPPGNSTTTPRPVPQPTWSKTINNSRPSVPPSHEGTSLPRNSALGLLGGEDEDLGESPGEEYYLLEVDDPPSMTSNNLDLDLGLDQDLVQDLRQDLQVCSCLCSCSCSCSCSGVTQPACPGQSRGTPRLSVGSGGEANPLVLVLV